MNNRILRFIEIIAITLFTIILGIGVVETVVDEV